MKVKVGDRFHRPSDRMNVRVMAVAEGFAMVVKISSKPPPVGQTQGQGYPFAVTESTLLGDDSNVWRRLDEAEDLPMGAR